MWNYKDRPSLWDTLERDWRRRARRAGSKAETLICRDRTSQKGCVAQRERGCADLWVSTTTVAPVGGYRPPRPHFLGRMLGVGGMTVREISRRDSSPHKAVTVWYRLQQRTFQQTLLLCRQKLLSGPRRCDTQPYLFYFLDRFILFH